MLDIEFLDPWEKNLRSPGEYRLGARFHDVADPSAVPRQQIEHIFATSVELLRGSRNRTNRFNFG